MWKKNVSGILGKYPNAGRTIYKTLLDVDLGPARFPENNMDDTQY